MVKTNCDGRTQAREHVEGPAPLGASVLGLV